MKKKFLVVVVFMVGFIVFNLSGIDVKAAELNVDQMKHLESLGFTEEEILNMPETEIMKNLEIDGEVVAIDEKFFKVIESDNDSIIKNPSREIELDENTYLREVQLEEAKRTVKYMDEKANHYLDIINGLSPDDTNPGEWELIHANKTFKGS